MYNNNIGDQGAIAIAKALEVNASVTELSLAGNSIGDAGAAAIANAIAVNATVLTKNYPKKEIASTFHKTLSPQSLPRFSCKHTTQTRTSFELHTLRTACGHKLRISQDGVINNKRL